MGRTLSIVLAAAVAGGLAEASVYAIGNPFGLERTMAARIVGATGPDIQSVDVTPGNVPA